jgi:hypothetical protein
MLAALRAGVSPLVMMVMVGHGAIGGGLSPITPMGVVADEKLADMGLAGHAGYTFAMNVLVNAVVAGAGYLLLRGWRTVAPRSDAGDHADATAAFRAEARHWLTLAAVAADAGIGRDEFDKIDDEVSAVIQRWPEFAAAAELPAATAERAAAIHLGVANVLATEVTAKRGKRRKLWE